MTDTADTVMETVLFRLNEDADPAAFVEAAKAASAWIAAQLGFLARRLSQTEDGQWIEQIEWESLAHAQAAATAIGKAEAVQPFVSAINGPSVAMHHSRVTVRA